MRTKYVDFVSMELQCIDCSDTVPVTLPRHTYFSSIRIVQCPECYANKLLSDIKTQKEVLSDRKKKKA